MQILYHANIYTFDPQLPKASAIAIENDRILAVGGDYFILSNFAGRLTSPKKTDLFDAQGLTILPGLTDAHIHLELYSFNHQKIGCETPSRAECLQRVAEKAFKNPSGTWIQGHGWNQNNWLEGYGTAGDLDRLCPDHPVYLTAKSLHAAWVNSQALHMAGIRQDTPNPPGGEIQRDETGQPTGILFENAMQLVESAIPAPTSGQTVQAIREVQPRLHRMGLTGLHDFDGATCFAALQTLHSNGELKLRVIKGIPHENMQPMIACGLHTGFGDDFLRIGNVKLFADGALGPHTAAMIQPYEGEPDNRGILMIDSEQFFEIGLEAVNHNLGLAVHAIGDRANHEILNGYTRIRDYTQNHSAEITPTRIRHRIEHVQLIHSEDAGRLADLGIIASMQPIHAPSDMDMADRFWGNRSAFAYAWQSQLQHGAVLAFGSDAPVESPNPFWGIQAAVTRCRADGSPGRDGWYPEQKLSVSEALKAYTYGPAYAAHLEDRLGMLAPNYLADLIVLPQDPFACAPTEIINIAPLATMVGGEWVYSRIKHNPMD
jgi:predicted amidohydrolase YtcJ